MATFAFLPQSSTKSGSPSPPDRRSKEIPPPLSLTIEAPAPSSPFPSPSSSFVPPPMPGAHEFANRPLTGRLVRQKKGSNASNVYEESGSLATSKVQNKERTKELNGIVPMDIDVRNLSSSPRVAVTPLTPTPDSLSMTPTSKSPPDADTPPYNLTTPHNPDDAEPSNLAEPSNTAISGRNTPTQMHIKLPSPPPSPSQIFGSKRTSSGCSVGTPSKHTSLSSSRPAPPSPSPAPSRRQSGVSSVRSRHRSGLSIASTSSSSKFGTLKSTPPLLQSTKRRGEIKVRDFAFPGVDLRHMGRGPDAPKVIKRLLKQHGPAADAGSRRASGMSESSVDSEEGSSRRSSGFGGWSALRWASKLGGPFGFGAVTSSGSGSGSGSGSRTSGIGGYTPSQQDFERNFDDTVDPEISDSPADDADEDYLSDYDHDGEGEGEELLPGLYRALYDFEPEGTAEMGLKEGQVIKVVGRGGGVGWAIAIRPDARTHGGEGEESNWALVPESYLRVMKLDGAQPDGELGKPTDDKVQQPIAETQEGRIE